jgi:hypothetical protein
VTGLTERPEALAERGDRTYIEGWEEERMKPLSLAFVAALAVGIAACQQSAPAGGASAAASPSPLAASAAPAPAQAAPAEAPATVAAPPAPVSAVAPPRAPEPLPPAGPSVAAAQEPSAPPAAAPAPTPVPTPAPVVVTAGTVLPVRLKETVTTKTAEPEDRVVAVMDENVSVGGKIVLPAGSEVLGSVVTAVRSGRVSGRAHLVVKFDTIRVEHRTYPISVTGFDVTAESSKGKDAKIAGGATAAGVVIGAIAGGGEGALKGGLIGGAAGGAAVLATRGKEVELPAGSRYRLTLRKSLTLD